MAVLAASCVVACSNDGDNKTQRTATATPSPASTATEAPSPDADPTFTPAPPIPTGLYELDAETGIESADRFLRLLHARDFETIAAEAAFLAIPCTALGAGIPSTPDCRDGEVDQTPVTALLLGSCEPGFIRLDQRHIVADRLAVGFDDDEAFLDSVWRVSPWEGAFNEHLGESYAVIVVRRAANQTAAYVIYLNDQGQYAGHTTCGDYREPVGNIEKLFPQ